MRIDTALLVVGRGPAALVVAKLAAGAGLPCLLAGHAPAGDGPAGDGRAGDDAPVGLTDEATATLERHGLVDVLRPYLDAQVPLTIAPRAFEEVVKHHCVADLNVVVYDGVTVVDRVLVGSGLHGVLTDGTSRWDLSADLFVDADLLPTGLSEAIVAGAAVAMDAVSGQLSPAPDLAD